MRWMKTYGSRIMLLLLFAAAILVIRFYTKDVFSFESIRENKEALLRLVEERYFFSVAGFLAAFVSTAFLIPGALVLSIAGGFLFGVIPGICYVITGATLGATLAFLSARYLIGTWVQRTYEMPLRAFNEEIAKHGHRYLFTLRIVPALPFFLVNYLAGLTRISLRLFVIMTLLGMLPGSFVYTFAGHQLERIDRVEDIFSLRLIVAFLLLALLALLPAVVDHVRRFERR
jgi:uncharacterized membrane protein YdjX (TVP38/TMEM64 family)